MPISDYTKQALSGGASQVASSMLGGIFSMIGQKKQRSYEREMYERQLADNRKNWELENMYNSPEAQMQRLKDAGLNPNLAYGNYSTLQAGSIDGANPQVSDQSKAFMPFAGMANAPLDTINTIYDLRMKDAQINLLHEQQYQATQNADLINSKRILTDILANKADLENVIGRRTMEQVIKQATLNLRLGMENMHNKRADTEMKQVSTNLAGSKTEGQDISNDLLDLERDLYKGTLNLPEGATKQLLQLLMFILKGAK